MSKAERKSTPEVVELNDEQAEALLNKASVSSLNPQEVETLRQIIETLRYITGELDKKRVSIKRLKAMLFGAGSEKTRSIGLEKLVDATLQGEASAAQPRAPGADDMASSSSSPDGGMQGDDHSNQQPATSSGDAPSSSSATQGGTQGTTQGTPTARPGHGRLGAQDYQGAERQHVPHPTLKPKDPCPKCADGKVYKQKRPKVLVRMSGSAPIQAKIWTYDWFRCNLCGAIFTAPLPPEAGPPEKFDASVVSAVANLHYDLGLPFHRLATYQSQVKIPLPTSTQWDLVNRPIPNLELVFDALIRRAAGGDIIHHDDTTSRILELMGLRREREQQARADGEEGRKRTGIFTTGLVSVLEQARIALFLTGEKHAGENLASVLERCEPGRAPLINMSDGLSRNDPTHLPAGLEVIFVDCMSHGRRKYVDIADSFPDKCLHVLVEIGKIYKHDATCRAEQMTPQERLAYHETHSAPIMDDLKAWLREQMEQRQVEPNGGFGKATAYMLKHWGRLTKFLTVAGAPLDNNIVERSLKRAIRYRKNSLFYKTLHGARVGDIYMSLIHTCHLNDVNPFEYLTAVVNAGDRVEDDPGRWLPWNYKAASGQAAA